MSQKIRQYAVRFDWMSLGINTDMITFVLQNNEGSDLEVLMDHKARGTEPYAEALKALKARISALVNSAEFPGRQGIQVHVFRVEHQTSTPKSDHPLGLEPLSLTYLLNPLFEATLHGDPVDSKRIES